VETIGDAYMVVSGAPTITPFHPLYVANMAFDMLAAMVDLIDPSTGSHMRIRVGKLPRVRQCHNEADKKT